MRKAVFIILALALVVFTGYKIKGRIDQTKALAQQTRQQRNQPQATVTVVKVMPLVPQPILETLRLAGEIKAEAEIAVQPRINGRLTTLLVEEGQMIRADQLVATLDDETIRLQMQQSEASMAAIQTNLRQAELTASRTKADQERYQELLAKRYISQRDYDIIETTYLNALASVEGYQAQLAAAQKNYELLRMQQGYTKIFSPATGIVVGKSVTVGMNLTTGTTMVTIAPVNPIKLEFKVDQKDTAKIRRGMRVTFSCDAFPDLAFSGTIDQVAPTFDPKTRTLSLAARLNNPGNKLLPGIFGTAEILVGGKEKALVVPQEAVVAHGEISGVFVVDRQQQAKFIQVTTGLSSEGQIEITSGLKPGDLVVVIGQNRLRDGQPVQMTGGEGAPGGRPRNRPDGSAGPGPKKAGENR